MLGIDSNVLTIGHSTHPLEMFAGLLDRHGVTALADVRAVPYSRFNPQFNRENLAAGLGPYEIKYVFLGSQLGGRSEDPSLYDNGRISYERLSATRSFQKGLDRVVRGARDHRIALMCAEKEPLECHRCLLIAPALEERGVVVTHMRPDGDLELHNDTMHQLLILHSMEDSIEEQRLFPRSRAERIREALAKQAHRFAHRHEIRVADSASPKLPCSDLHP